MPQVINTNVASINAQRQLNRSQEGSNTALQRLSSGLRINSAKDDAAGLAISTRFSAQIRGTEVAIRNAGDGISLAQTAEGALGSISDSLQRIRELALQSANATNTDLDRAALQEEVDQLKSEIDSVAAKTNFNGQKLLDGSFGKQTFQTGSNVGDSIDVQINGARADQLGSSQKNGLSSVSTENTATMVQGDLIINGVSIGAAVAAADGASTANQNISAIAKAAAINAVADQTGVDAVVNTNYVGGSQAGSISAGNVTINGLSIELPGSASVANYATDLQAVADAINATSGQTGVSASVDINQLDGGVQLAAADGRNIIIEDGSAQAWTFGLATAGVYTGTYTLVSRDGSDIEIGSSTGNSMEGAGLEVGAYSGTLSAMTSAVLTEGINSVGAIKINGVAVGLTRAGDDGYSTANNSESAIAFAAAINRVSTASGVTAEINVSQLTSGTVSANQSGNVSINGVSINFAAGTMGTTSEQVGLIVDAINTKSAQTGVEALLIDEDQYELRAADGRNIVIASSNGAGLTDGVYRGSVTLLSGGPIDITSNSGGATYSLAFGVGRYGGGESGQLIKDLDISTVAGANLAVQAVDNALQSVSSQQGRLGAIQNRFDATVKNLQTSHENLSAANSRITDADFARETANMAKFQVLQQAGVSILAQANARSQQALSLLG